MSTWPDLAEVCVGVGEANCISNCLPPILSPPPFPSPLHSRQEACLQCAHTYLKQQLTNSFSGNCTYLPHGPRH